MTASEHTPKRNPANAHPYEARRLSGTDLGKTIKFHQDIGGNYVRHVTGELLTINHRNPGGLVDLKVMANGQLRFITDLDPNTLVELTGQPGPPWAGNIAKQRRPRA